MTIGGVHYMLRRNDITLVVPRPMPVKGDPENIAMGDVSRYRTLSTLFHNYIDWAKAGHVTYNLNRMLNLPFSAIGEIQSNIRDLPESLSAITKSEFRHHHSHAVTAYMQRAPDLTSWISEQYESSNGRGS